MRLADGDALPGLVPPGGDEGAVDVAVQLACRIVGNIQQRGSAAASAPRATALPSRRPMVVRRVRHACRISSSVVVP